jgi:hypothetical protein
MHRQAGVLTGGAIEPAAVGRLNEHWNGTDRLAAAGFYGRAAIILEMLK